MNKILIIALFILLFLMAVIFVWFYIFNIYEVKIEVSENYLIANSNSEIEIKSIPLNSFGRIIPFRKVESQFNIIKGDSLVSVKSLLSDKIILSEIGKPGEVEVLVKSKLGLFPSKINFKIIENKQ